MRIAVIDLGTNTFNLLIAEINLDDSFQKLFSNRIPVKLGESSINSGYISEGPYERGMSALKQYKEVIDRYQVSLIKAFATSAIRTASNGKQFVNDALHNFGITVETIDGNREAELIYKGVSLGVKLDDSISLIMDIGGGSTEFIICDKHQIFWKKSFLLGAARLLDKFKPEDPITKETYNAFNQYFKEELTDLEIAVKEFSPNKLIGSSGAFDSFIDMIAHPKNEIGVSDKKTEYFLDIDAYKTISKKTIHSTLEERKQMKGLIAIRLDMIVISYLFTDYILNSFNFHTFIASTYSLKEGVIAEVISKSKGK